MRGYELRTNEHQQVFVVWGHIELERHDRALLSALNATRIREPVTALIKRNGKLLIHPDADCVVKLARVDKVASRSGCRLDRYDDRR